MVPHSRWLTCSHGLIPAASSSVAVALCIFMGGTGLRGTSVTASCTGGLEHRAAWNTLAPTLPDSIRHSISGPHITQGLISPTLFSGTFTAGMGWTRDLSWSPGGTTHHALQMGGGTGGLVAPAEACVPGRGSKCLGPLAQAHNGRG